MNELVLVVPIGVGALIAALVGIGKYLGWVKEDQGGKVSLGLNLAVGLLLFMLTNYFEVDVESDAAQAIYQILGLIAILLMQFVTSWSAQRISKAAKLYRPRNNR